MTAYVNNRKIAIKNLAILQTGDLPAILRCRRIFAPHRIGYIRLIAKMASASSGSQLTGFPKNQSLFLGGYWSGSQPYGQGVNPLSIQRLLIFNRSEEHTSELQS